MPKGFLVKRQRHSGTYASWRSRKNCGNDEERHSDSGSDQENVYTAFGSPDSGYSASPVSLTFKDTVDLSKDFKDISKDFKDLSKDFKDLSKDKDIGPPPAYTERTVLGSLSTAPSSPLSVGTSGYPSPFHFTSFDRLTVSSPASRPSPGGSSVASRGSPGPVLGPLGTFSPPVPASATMPPPALPSNPNSPSKKRLADTPAEGKPKTPKKSKAARKITFDEDKTSPVSGTIIRDFDDDEGAHFVSGDIDPSMNYVEITPEAKAEIARIDNKIGDYICQLCKEFYQDAFQLAQHKCSRIVHVEYRCPECDKVFNCPANLASHRRWHKPRPNKPSQTKLLPNPASPAKSESSEERRSPSPTQEGQYDCPTCGKKFKRQAYLRKHQASHNKSNQKKDVNSNMPPMSIAMNTLSMNNQINHMKSMNMRALPPPQTAPLALTTAARHSSEALVALTSPRHSTESLCSVCSLTFPDKPALERHMQVHASEAYTCKYCPSTFYSSPGLTRHINKCHPSESRQIVMLQIPVNRTC